MDASQLPSGGWKHHLPLELRGQHGLIEDGDGSLDGKPDVDVRQEHLAVEQTGQRGLHVSSHQEVTVTVLEEGSTGEGGLE